MAKSDTTRKIVALSTGAAIGLSATAVVLLQEPGTSSDHLKSVKSALRDGTSAVTVSPDKSRWIRVAVKTD